MSNEVVERTGVARRLVWVLLAVAGAALFVRIACYKRARIESCTACLRESPTRCATSTADTRIARQPYFDARENARTNFSCGEVRDQTCRLRPMEDFAFTCEMKEVDLPPDLDAPFTRLSPR